MDKFQVTTFSGPTFQIQSVDKPKIKAGGSSSSTLLNRYAEACLQDILLLSARTNVLATRTNRLYSALSTQSGALLSALQSVSSRVDAASGYSQVLADIHSSFYINTGATTANLNTTWGQATLPIRSMTDLLVQPDTYGNLSVFGEVEISYAYGSAPDSLGYTIDVDALEMLRERQFWLQDSTSQNIWIKIKAPLQFRGLTPNVLEIYPLPYLGLNLLEVAYQRAGDSFTGTWLPLDLSYLPGYSSSTATVPQVGPIRLHLPNEPLSQIRINLQPRSATPWGLFALKLYHVEYESSATLVVQDPYSRTVGTSTIRGKNPSTLSLLSKTTTTNSVSIALTTTDAATTPVITGVIMAVS